MAASDHAVANMQKKVANWHPEETSQISHDSAVLIRHPDCKINQENAGPRKHGKMPP